MLCQKCGKNEVEVHFVQTVNGDTVELMLCGLCAAKEGLGISPISFTSFLTGFMDINLNQEQKKELTCEKCGLTLTEMKRTAKVGCKNCYSIFGQQILPLIKNVQLGVSHTGKYPKRANHISAGREINALKQRLSDAVKAEEFEEAAKLRDRIKALEGGCADE